MISKELFCEVFEDLKKADDYQIWLNEQLQAKGVEGYIFQPSCIDSTIKLLCDCFSEYDSNDMISYFCFELSYGRKWKSGMITEKNGSDINLSSPSYLYDYLTKQKNDGGVS